MPSERIVHFSATAERPLTGFLNPVRMVRDLVSHRDLIFRMTHRDIVGRYREAKLGLLWTVLTPLFLLAIYTFVFSVVFKARWNLDSNETHAEFALYLFSGMLVFQLFGEVATRAPGMVVAYPNYVKKVVFPLEVLPISALLTALFHMSIGFVVWLAAWLVIKQVLPPITALYFPIVILPVCIATLGVSWVLAAFGVFLRDLGHAVALFVQALFFLTPVFYPVDRIPVPLIQKIMRLNPLTFAIETTRGVIIVGEHPDWLKWFLMVIGSIFVAVFGYAVFMKARRAFADVL
jgi:lipopolysaccharide transport system permease protein